MLTNDYAITLISVIKGIQTHKRFNNQDIIIPDRGRNSGECWIKDNAQSSFIVFPTSINYPFPKKMAFETA